MSASKTAAPARRKHRKGCQCHRCTGRLPARYEKNGHHRVCDCHACAGPLGMRGVPDTLQRDVLLYLLGSTILRIAADNLDTSRHVCESSPEEPSMEDCLGCFAQREAAFVLELLERTEHLEQHLPTPTSDLVWQLWTRIETTLIFLLPACPEYESPLPRE